SEAGVRKVDNPRNFGVAEMDSGQKILRLVERPMIPKSNMALVGIFKIKETALLFETLDYCIQNKICSADGEYHLTEALQRTIEKGMHLQAFKVNNWFDCGK